ncbi:nucleoside phosphorylase domain-containing protein [Microdochium trichocladiopsis]|uniref:Nucleoside phosphorylase domain-containing protein n=1 Tax=Microdochium trichocladiopsis TaxID=1682393 RepID=A0A9P8Y5H5_9PEZI|nr:nucleoside phosphorylase domain-containing protein [Microdochium trichocladiopsis]KAH7031567.1 nucleoside phosphorylase domain-containing protein [Microdochium trichocladiopsis]
MHYDSDWRNLVKHLISGQVPSNHEAHQHVPGPDGPSRRGVFSIAIICALPLEYDAVSLLFDESWDEQDGGYGRAAGDTNTYSFGRVGRHNVVLVLLPNMGSSVAAGSAASLRSSFPSLSLALLVGVCGGVPGTGADERLLGDVVISKIVYHDISKQYPASLVLRDTVEDALGRPKKEIRNLVTIFETEAGEEQLQTKAGSHLQELQARAVRLNRRTNYHYPGVDEDKLFAADYRHGHHEPQLCVICNEGPQGSCRTAAQASCTELGCDERRLVPRTRIEMRRRMAPEDQQRPRVIIGSISSGNIVMKSGEHRDQIAQERGVVAFEMEGAGVWDEVPCIVVKGICDYADSHKNKVWQPFAAAAAAAVTKAVLGRHACTD